MKDINGISARLGDTVVDANSNEFFVHSRYGEYTTAGRCNVTWHVVPMNPYCFIDRLDQIGPFTIKDVVLRQQQLELNFSGAL
jgi:hypothetical protein